MTNTNHWLLVRKQNQQQVLLEQSYANYLKELADNADKWQSSKLLIGYAHDEHFANKAMILENMALFYRVNRSEISKKLFELTQIILRDWAIFDLVSVQPMLGPCSMNFFRKKSWKPKEILQSQEVAAKTRILCSIKEGFPDMPKLATDFKDAITREIITDLRNNVATLKQSTRNPDVNKIHDDIVEMNININKKTNRENEMWVLTSKQIANKIRCYCVNDFDLDKITECTKVGSISGKYDLFVNPFMAPDSLLCGAKYCSNNMIDGYFYNPYIFLSFSNTHLDPDSTDSYHSIASRYSKKLINKNFYARIVYDS